MFTLPEPPLLYPRNISGVETITVEVSSNRKILYVMPPTILYHYTSIDTAYKILEGSKLKFSAPSTFNDPFDMYEGLVDFTATTQQKNEWGRNVFANQPRQQKRKLKKLINKTGDKFPLITRSAFTAMKTLSGVCCFSEFSNVQLMWSHYANKHNGVCLGFDFHPIVNRFDFNLEIRQVNYPNKIIPINFQSERDAAIAQWLSTKSKVWEYEHEYRIIIHDRNGRDFFNFERPCLKEIYFGCKVQQKDIDNIVELLITKSYTPRIKKKMIIDDSIFDIKAIDL